MSGLLRIANAGSPLTRSLVGLLLLSGAVGWLSPFAPAARQPAHRDGKSPSRHSPLAAIPHEPAAVISLTPEDSQGALCLHGTSIAAERRYAIIGGRVVTEGQTLETNGSRYLVLEIADAGIQLQAIDLADNGDGLGPKGRP